MTSAALLTLAALYGAAPGHGHQAAESKLQAGKDEMSKGNFDAAVRDFDAALGEASDAQTLAHIQLLRGQAFGAKQDFVQAEAAFAEALEFDPEASLDAGKVDPGLVKVLESLKARLKGELRISADQPGAQIKVDGADVGVAPTRMEASIGRHTVEAVSSDGHFVAKQRVLVRPRTGARVDLLMSEVTSVAAAVTRSGPNARADKSFIPFAELRLDLDLSTWFNFADPHRTTIAQLGDNFDGSIGEMVGGGFRSRFFRASASIRFRPWVGVHLRGALGIPLGEHWDGYVSAEVLGDWIFAQLELSLGASVGAEYLWGDFFGPFAEIGARHDFGSGGSDDVVLQTGVRIWFP